MVIQNTKPHATQGPLGLSALLKKKLKNNANAKVN